MGPPTIVMLVEDNTAIIKAIRRCCRGVGAYEPARTEFEAITQLLSSVQALFDWNHAWFPHLDHKRDQSREASKVSAESHQGEAPIGKGAISVSYIEQRDARSESAQSYWGLTGSEYIRAHLESLTRLCRDVLEPLEVATKRSSSRFQETAKRISQSLSISRRKPLSELGTSWRDKVLSLTYQVDLLWTMSEIAFKSTHPTSDPMSPVVKPVSYWGSVAELLRNQAESLAFYEFCRHQPNGFDLELDMFGSCKVLDQPSTREFSFYNEKRYLIYRRSTAAPHASESWLVRPSIKIQSKLCYGIEALAPSYDFAALDRLENSEGSLCLTLPFNEYHSQVQISMDQVRSISDEERDSIESLSTEKCLHAKEEDVLRIEEDQVYLMPLHEKYQLAYSIAEFCLFFLGTPWISHLRLGSLRKRPGAQGSNRFSVHVMDFDDDHGTPPISIRNQILKVGEMLMTLALRNYSNSDNVHVKSEDLLNVQGTMGHQYRAACEFCLRRSKRLGSSRSRQSRREHHRDRAQSDSLHHGRSDIHVQEEKADSSSDERETDSDSTDSEPGPALDRAQLSRTSSADDEWSWLMVDREESLIESMSELQQFYDEVFLRSVVCNSQYSIRQADAISQTQARVRVGNIRNNYFDAMMRVQYPAKNSRGSRIIPNFLNDEDAMPLMRIG